MTKASYSRGSVKEVLVELELPLIYRIIEARHLATPLGVVAANSRFGSKPDGIAVLYGTPDLNTAIIEQVMGRREGITNRRKVDQCEVVSKGLVVITSKLNQKLALLDLQKDGCYQLEAPTDAVHAKNHAAGRAFSRAIHSEHEYVDGIIFKSRITGEPVYAIYCRAIHKLSVVAAGKFTAGQR